VIKIFKNFMQRVRRKDPQSNDKSLHQENEESGENQDDQNSNDDEFRALYLDKEKEKEYVFNPKETNAFEAQNEFEGSGEYSVNLSKDHTNHFNEEAEQSFFRKFLNIFLSKKLLAILTALLIKLATIAESIASSLNIRSKTKYKIVSSLLKLLMKMQLMLSLRLMQMLLLLNKKLIEFDKKYLGGSGASKEKQGEMKNLRDNQERKIEREQYRSLEIGNLEEQRRSEYLRDKAFNQNRENLVAQEKNEWQKYQDLSKSLTKNVESKVELSKSSSIAAEKDPIKKSEDFAAKMYYLRLSMIESRKVIQKIQVGMSLCQCQQFLILEMLSNLMSKIRIRNRIKKAQEIMII